MGAPLIVPSKVVVEQTLLTKYLSTSIKDTSGKVNKQIKFKFIIIVHLLNIKPSTT
jgi:hypothetical protein